MKLRIFIILLVLLSSLLLNSCQAAESLLANSEDEQRVDAAPTPSPDKAVLTGKSLDVNGNTLKDTPVRLATIYRQGDQGAFIIDAATSPGAITDVNGIFTFVDIPPAEYMIVVGYLENNNYAIYQDKNGKPYTYTVKAGEKLDVGTIKLDFAP